MNSTYCYELKEKADVKGIKTFGDIAKAFGVDVSDIWPFDEPDDLNAPLYWCDGATQALEILSEEGVI